MKTIISTLFLAVSLFSPMADANEKSPPVAYQVNQILHQRLGTFTEIINEGIKADPEATAKKVGEQHTGNDKVAYIEVLKTIKKERITIRKAQKGFVIVAAGQKTVVEVIDYMNLDFKINGESFTYSPKLGFAKNYELLKTQLLKRRTSFLSFFINDAHAWIPIVIGAVAAATFVVDIVASPAANDIANAANKDVALKINELEKKYQERADQCENDLASSYGMGSSNVAGLGSVKVVSSLIEELNAELYDEWFNGKEQIDYDKFSCEAYDGMKVSENSNSVIRNKKIVGVSPFNGSGQALKKLCGHQDRLNSCFEEIEEVMRKNNIQVNDVSGPDSIGPLNDVVEDYKKLQGASSL